MGLRFLDKGAPLLQEWYEELTQSDDVRNRATGEKMLLLIRHLNNHPIAQECWVYTNRSHHILLVPAPSAGAAVAVFVRDVDLIYQINYPLPRSIAPWPYAYVVGEANDHEDAMLIIEIAWKRLSESYSEFQ